MTNRMRERESGERKSMEEEELIKPNSDMYNNNMDTVLTQF